MRLRTAYGLLFGCVLLACPEMTWAQAVMSEVMWAGSDVSTADEWVELAVGDWQLAIGRVDIGGWRLTTRKGSGEETVMFEFPEGTTIEPGQLLLVANYGAAQSRLATEPDFVTTAMSLPNTKLLLRLYNASGELVDEVDDGVGDPFAGDNGLQGASKASMERIDLAAPGHLKENWTTAEASRGFDATGPEIFGTPGFGIRDAGSGSEDDPPADPMPDPDQDAPPIERAPDSDPHREPESRITMIITEVLANPQGRDDAEWIELANLGETSVDLAGFKLGTASSSRRFTIEDSQLLKPGAFVAFAKDQTGVALRNESGAVSVWDADGDLVDSIEYPTAIEDVSFGRGAEDASKLQHFCIPTPGGPNTPPPLDPQISIQSGETEGVGELSINLEATLTQGSLAAITCSWDYGDGFASDSCNPPSHRFTSPGIYGIRLHVEAICNESHDRALTVRVAAKDEPLPPARRNPPGEGGNLEPEPEPDPTPTPDPMCRVKVGDVIVSAALPNPKGKDLEGEWIELSNLNDTFVKLNGCALDNKEGGSAPFALAGVQLEPNAIARFTIERTGIVLTNGEDSARLLDSDGAVLSMLSWANAREGQIERPPVLSSPRVPARVVRVIDGDTIDVELIGIADLRGVPGSLLRRWQMIEEKDRSPSIRVRLLGIDAPESVHPFRDVSPFGMEASDSLRALVLGQKVELEFDTKIWDHYERLLAYIFKDGALVQEQLLQGGLANRELRYPFARSAAFAEFEREAKRAKRGIWSVPEAKPIEVEETEGVPMPLRWPTPFIAPISNLQSPISNSESPITNHEPSPHPTPSLQPTPYRVKRHVPPRGFTGSLPPTVRPRYHNISSTDTFSTEAPPGSSMFDGLTFVAVESATQPLQKESPPGLPIPMEPFVITLIVLPAARMLFL